MVSSSLPMDPSLGHRISMSPERRTMHGRLAQYALVQFTFTTHLDTADRKYFSSVTRSEQVFLNNQLLHDANFSPNREGAKAHAFRSSGQVSALCSES